MRTNRTVTEEAAQVEYVSPDHGQPLDLLQLFRRFAPLELDLGCGDGSFLAALAAEHPDRNYLGVERLPGRVRSACRKIAAQRLTNARILRVDIADAATSLLSAASVDVCHIMFPDPWPKRRHHRRRSVTVDLLRAIHGLLVPGGVLRLTTDDAPYFEEMQRVAAAVREFEAAPDPGVTILPPSTFERRFTDCGMMVYRLVLRKLSPET